MIPASLLLWWIRQLALILIGIGFFLFGIQLLISAYQLQDPFVFVLTFFSPLRAKVLATTPGGFPVGLLTNCCILSYNFS